MDVAGYWPVFVWEDGAAWERVQPYHHYIEWKYEDAQGARGRLGRFTPPPLDAESEAAIRATMKFPSTVGSAVASAEYAEAAGPRFHFVARMYYPGMDPAMMRESTTSSPGRCCPRSEVEASA